MMRQRRASPYYGELPAAAPAKPEPVIGAPAIAAELGITVRQLYRIIEASKKPGAAAIPIGKVPGLGLSAQRPALRSWWERIVNAGVADTRNAA